METILVSEGCISINDIDVINNSIIKTKWYNGILIFVYGYASRILLAIYSGNVINIIGNDSIFNNKFTLSKEDSNICINLDSSGSYGMHIFDIKIS